MASNIQIALSPLGFRYHGLHLDLQRVTINRLRLVCHGGGANKSIYSAPPPSPP